MIELKEDTRNLRHVLRSLRKMYRKLEEQADLVGSDPQELSKIATVMQKVAKSMLDYNMALKNPQLAEISSDAAKTDLAMLIQEADNVGKNLLMVHKGPDVKPTKRSLRIYKNASEHAGRRK